MCFPLKTNCQPVTCALVFFRLCSLLLVVVVGWEGRESMGEGGGERAYGSVGSVRLVCIWRSYLESE